VPDAASHFNADLFVLSATLTTQLAALEAMIHLLRHDGGPKVLIGGRALAAAPDLWKRLGADGYAADAAGAVEVGARLVGL
jgi:methanogenic corrinoid protein MtbC1